MMPSLAARSACPRPLPPPSRPPNRLKESTSEYDYQNRSSLDAGLSKVPPPPRTPTAGLNSEATAVVEGSLPSGREVRAAVHEVDVRSSFAGLPKVKPHWISR